MFLELLSDFYYEQKADNYKLHLKIGNIGQQYNFSDLLVIESEKPCNGNAEHLGESDQFIVAYASQLPLNF